MHYACNFLRTLVISADFSFWIESACLCSEGKEFHIVGVANVNEQCQNVFVRCLGIHGILLSEDRKFHLGV